MLSKVTCKEALGQLSPTTPIPLNIQILIDSFEAAGGIQEPGSEKELASKGIFLGYEF